jgi:hypothetical protein
MRMRQWSSRRPRHRVKPVPTESPSSRRKGRPRRPLRRPLLLRRRALRRLRRHLHLHLLIRRHRRPHHPRVPRRRPHRPTLRRHRHHHPLRIRRPRLRHRLPMCRRRHRQPRRHLLDLHRQSRRHRLPLRIRRLLQVRHLRGLNDLKRALLRLRRRVSNSSGVSPAQRRHHRPALALRLRAAAGRAAPLRERQMLHRVLLQHRTPLRRRPQLPGHRRVRRGPPVDRRTPALRMPLPRPRTPRRQPVRADKPRCRPAPRLVPRSSAMRRPR